MAWLEKLLQDLLLLAFGGSVMGPLIVEILVAVGFAIWLRRREPNYPIPVVALFGVIAFAVFLFIDIQYKSEADKIARDREKQVQEQLAAQAKTEIKKSEKEKASPEYLQSQIITWLDAAGFSHKTIPVETGERFRIEARDIKGIVYFISQYNDVPSGLIVQHIMRPFGPLAARLKTMKQPEREAFSRSIEIELLRLGIPHEAIIGENTFIKLREEFPIDREGSGIDMLHKLFDLNRGQRLIQIYTMDMLEKNKHKSK